MSGSEDSYREAEFELSGRLSECSGSEVETIFESRLEGRYEDSGC